MRREKQGDWKRTQVRMPQDQYDDVVKYAEQSNLSLNSAMLELMGKGLEYVEKFSIDNEEDDNVSREIRLHLKSIERLLVEKDFLKSL